MQGGIKLFFNQLITAPFSEVENAKDEKIHQMIHTHEFKLEHIVENKDRSQNSTACITIQPYDIFPYPKVNVRY